MYCTLYSRLGIGGYAAAIRFLPVSYVTVSYLVNSLRDSLVNRVRATYRSLYRYYLILVVKL